MPPLVRPPMTATQKLLAHQTGRPFVQQGDLLKVPVSWVIASELSLKGMRMTHREMGEPDLFRNDRFFLAIDHTVSPFRQGLDAQQERGRNLAIKAREFARRHRLKYFSDANTSILHTRPYQEFFLPGDIVVGTDSHTTMHGGLGCFSIGVGAAEGMLAAVLGAFLFQVPETIRINIKGKLPPVLVGKDLILHILGLLKRNTVALERIVEYGGEGLQTLSASDRGSISNMGAEFGAAVSYIEPDEMIARFVAARRTEFNEGGLYFHADEGALYREVFDIDLGSDLAPQIAEYGSPDDVYSVTDPKVAGRSYDIAFVGSCTTTPEEFVLAALMADAAIKAGLRPIALEKPRGRYVAPSSMGIFSMLQAYGLVQPLKDLGFAVGEAGCSYCLGIDGDGAPAGTRVLGSHNRTFENRTGKGSESNVASAATVVASAVDMRLRDARELLPHFDRERYEAILRDLRGSGLSVPEIRLTEPRDVPQPDPGTETLDGGELIPQGVIRTRAVRIEGENVDTDAIIAGKYCFTEDVADMGRHALEYFKRGGTELGEEGLRRLVQDQGQGALVASHGWGSGSSREEAAYALIGAGVQVVIAKSIAYIHRRNLANQALPFRLIHPEDQEAFYRALRDGVEVEIDLERNIIRIPNLRKRRKKAVFRLLPIEPVEEAIHRLGGLAGAYKQHGARTFEAILGLARQVEQQRAA